MASFNVERFVALTFGLATAGAIGAAVWSATRDEQPAQEQDNSKTEGEDRTAPLNAPDVASPQSPPVENPPKAVDDARPADSAPPHPAVETPSWE